MSEVKIVINGSVSHSQILAAGGDIVFGKQPIAVDPFYPPGRVLVTCLDWELRDASREVDQTTKGYADSLKLADLELRILLAVIPPEGCLVLPPSYYCESNLARQALFGLAEAIESGEILLIGDGNDFQGYMVQKKARYAKARHFSRYEAAYYSPTYSPIDSMPFQRTAKLQSVGLRGLEIWSEGLDKLGLSVSSDAIRALRSRALETEKSAFLWENLKEHISSVGLNSETTNARKIRLLKNRSYLAAYSECGFEVPVGSALVADLAIPACVNRGYDMRSWIALFKIAGLLPSLMSSTSKVISQVKRRQEVSRALGVARQLFSEGRTADGILGELEKLKFYTGLTRGFVCP